MEEEQTDMEVKLESEHVNFVGTSTFRFLFEDN